MTAGLGAIRGRLLVVALCAFALPLLTPGFSAASAAQPASKQLALTAKKHKSPKKKHKAGCKVPKLKGDSLAKAKRALKHAHCATGKVTHKSSSKVAKGHVISSKPKAGSKHKAGTKVALTISSASKSHPPKKGCKVPKLKGMPLATAETALKNANCAVGKITQKPSSKISQGDVISSKPKTGSKHKSGTKVALTVSSGSKSHPPKNGCVVPDVIGQPLANAEAAIANAGCAVGKTKQKASSTVPKGNVISTSPKAGSKHKAGTKVKLTVSSGPKPSYHVP